MKANIDPQKPRRDATNSAPNVQNLTTITMNVLPWPEGSRFVGGEIWLHFVLSQTERERLDSLVGLALLDNSVCECLVTKRDPALFAALGLSERTQNWLSGINAATLKELAEAIIAATKSFYFESCPT